MSEQPEALRLIQHMDDEYPEDWDGIAICDELRRQHDEIEQLKAERDAAEAERDALLADAERYRYLRNRNSAQVLEMVGPAAGCWIDCDDEDGGLCLLTGQDADATIDAARSEP